MNHILLITTGGTIASINSNEGLISSVSSKSIIESMHLLSKEYIITPLDLFAMDSSNIQPEEWQQIAQCIYDNYSLYDGIVLTHGTDTMAYSASALSFMLINIPIPVVITGSQLPLSHPLSDGLENLSTAFAMAASHEHGIFIAFNRKVILGTRAVKTRTLSFDAFDSINKDYLAVINGRGMVINHSLIPNLNGAFLLKDDICSEVFLLKLTPGFNPQIFDMLLSMNYKGIVIEAFGIGGMQYIRRDLISKLATLLASGVIIVVCSQCLYESSDFSIYEVGQKALKQGVIECYDMTSEAVYTKLMWALASTNSLEEIRKMFKYSYAGEIDMPEINNI